MNARAVRRLSIFAIVLILAAGCRQQEKTTVVARVGNTSLTTEEIRSHIGVQGQPSDDELRRYVNHWVNEELVYQEAQRRGIDRSEQFAAKVNDTERHLLVQAFLDFLADNDTSHPADSVLQAYYSAHADEFIVRDNMVRLNAFRFLTRERAAAFAALVTRGVTWEDAALAASRDSVDKPLAIPSVSGQYVNQHTVFPPELWKVAGSLGTGEVSFPVNTAVGWCVIQPLGRITAGSRAGFEIARTEIIQRVGLERRRTQYNELLGTLRNRYSVELMLPGNQQSDSSSTGHD